MPVTFLQLPLEIREIIYKACLSYDGVLTPYPTQFNKDEGLGPFSNIDRNNSNSTKPIKTLTPTYYTTPLERDQSLQRSFANGNEKPTLALLGVNRQIRSEAKDLFTRVNLWRWKFSHSDNIRQSQYQVPWHSQWRVQQAFSPRHVVMSWDSRDLDHMDSIRITTEIAMAFSAYGSMMEPTTADVSKAKQDFAHRRRWDALKAVWASQVYLLRNTAGIRSVVIDVTNAYCPGGCCRKFKEVLVDTIAGKFESHQQQQHQDLDNNLSSSSSSYEDSRCDDLGARSPLSRHPQMLKSTCPETIAHNIKFIGLLDRTDEKQLAHSCGVGCDACTFSEDERLSLLPCVDFPPDRRAGLKLGLPRVKRQQQLQQLEEGKHWDLVAFDLALDERLTRRYDSGSV